MDEMINKAIKALEDSCCNEIELTDITGLKVRVVKAAPVIWYYYPSAIPSSYQYGTYQP